MRARRSIHSTRVFSLPGGNEDNDLWVYDMPDDANGNVIISVWEPTEEERKQIAEGQNIRLLVWAPKHVHLPVAMDVSDEALGKPA